MAERAQLAEAVARRYSALRPHLDERQRRLLLGSEAVELGWGGVKAVAAATGRIRTRSRGVSVRSKVSRSGRCGCAARAVVARS